MLYRRGKYLNQGLGSKAISEFLNIHGVKYSHIFVDTNSHNIAAIKCYKKLGFKKISEQEDAEKILIIKELLPVHTQN